MADSFYFCMAESLVKLPHFLDIPSDVGATEPHAAVRLGWAS